MNSQGFDSINLNSGLVHNPPEQGVAGVNFRLVPGSVSNSSEEDNDEEQEDDANHSEDDNNYPFRLTRKLQHTDQGNSDSLGPRMGHHTIVNGPASCTLAASTPTTKLSPADSGSKNSHSTPIGSNNHINNILGSRINVEDVPNVAEDVFFLNPSEMSGSAPLYKDNTHSPERREHKEGNTEEEVYGDNYDDDHDEDDELFRSKLRSGLFEVNFFLLETDRVSAESPVEYLLNRGMILEQELTKNIDLQEKMLASGDPSLQKIRLMISQNFDQISENNQSLFEVYTKDLQNTTLLYKRFQDWDKKRQKVLAKIKLIKNPKSKYGRKLAELADKSNDIDSEISILERKLHSLRQKREIIHDEIENTTSILESRTSSYVEAFKNLESQGEQAIQSILDLSGLSRADHGNLLKKHEIDVTFAKSYNGAKTERSKRTQSNPPPTIMPQKSTDIPTLNGISMQPYILPDSTPLPPSNSASLSFLPYDKGYAMGSHVSQNAKAFVTDILLPKINYTVNAYTSKISNEVFSNQKKPLILDDGNNTITEMLLLEPIVTLLDVKIRALEDLLVQHSFSSKSYKDYSTIWKDVVDLVNHMENDLFCHISSSTSNGPDKGVLTILSLCLGNVRARFEVQVQSSRHSSNGSHLFAVLLNEIKSIISAISMVSRDPSYLSTISELEEVAGLKKNKINHNSKSTTPVPTGFMNTGVDERTKAERELVKRSKPKESGIHIQTLAKRKDKIV